MSDYLFMLENHLSAAQSKMVMEVQNVAAEANVNVFLTGGAMRDMLGGFPMRDIEFTVEGSGVKLAMAVAAKSGAEITDADDGRKAAALLFPGSVNARIVMAHQERYGKTGAKPHIQPATIHEDLRGRDFTINAIALSLSKASRGLILDPNNGIGDLEHKELRAVSNYTLYHDPIRLFRLQRLRVRLGFEIEERTKVQYANARAEKLETHIPASALLEELRRIADEPNPGELLSVLDREKLLPLFSPALEGAKLNLPAFQKLQKAHQLIPFGVNFELENFGLFLYLLTEKLTPKERAALVKSLEMPKEDVALWQKLDARSHKLGVTLQSAKLQKPSRVYHALVKEPGDQILYLLLRSQHRLVQDRIRNYLQKYLPAAQEITDKEVLAGGQQPGTPKGEKLRESLINARLDARPKKIVPPVEEAAPVPAPPPVSAFAGARRN